jgi:hypothetical protein
VVVPSEKVMVPVGTMEPEAGLTALVKVMLVPLTTVVALAVRAVVVETGLAVTTSVCALEVLLM